MSDEPRKSRREPDTRILLLKLFTTLWKKAPWPVRHWRGEFWRWANNAYTPLTDDDLAALLTNALTEVNHAIDPSQVRRLIDAARWETKILDSEPMPIMQDPADPNLYQAQPNYFAFSNGLLDISNLFHGAAVIYPHTPLWFSDHIVSYPYRKRAECPKWHAFMDQSLPDPELRELLQMWFGLMLVHDTSHQKFLLVHGPTSTGKSVMLSILTRMVGESSTSAVPLQAFGRDFAIHRTLGKRMNVDPDMSELARVDEGALKSYVGGDLIHINRKYRDPIDCYPTARLVFCTNDLPHISDKSNATWRRMILIPFECEVPPESQNKHLVASLTKELSGIWNWAFRGLLALRKRGSFPEPKAVIAAMEAYKMETSSVRQWLDEMCTQKPDDTIATATAYTRFRLWSDSRGYRSPSQRSFGRSLKHAAPEISKRQRRVNGQVEYYYQGLWSNPIESDNV